MRILEGMGKARVIRSDYPTPASDPAETGLQRARDGKMWLDGRFRSELEAAGLTGFDAVMATSQGECLRVLKDRENWRLELRAARRPARRLFLKRHRVRSWRSRLWAKLGGGPPETAGRTEARNIRRLVAHGIGSMDLVAYGEDLRPDGQLVSFVLTDELKGYLPLDDFLKERFPRQESRVESPESRVRSQELRVQSPEQNRQSLDSGLSTLESQGRDLDRLIREVARVARELHDAGYNHRDLYCCHFFVREAAPGRFQVKLIDLQRVEHRRRFRRRWLVKDLAQLAYSAPRDRITRTHRLAFVREYLGVKKLSPGDKRLVRSVLAKQRRMERREGLPE